MKITLTFDERDDYDAELYLRVEKTIKEFEKERLSEEEQ